MRILYGIISGIIWTFISALVMAEYGFKVSVDIQWLSLAVVIAGAMAGGDD